MISCEQHDHIEIVCTYQFPIKLSLKSGDIIEGIANDTCLDNNRAECISIIEAGVPRLVILDQVTRLDVLIENPFFSFVLFTPP